jgi:hypothetical protein
MSLIKWIAKSYKMADAESIFKNHFKEYQSTLNQTSYDDKNDIYLCNDTMQIVYDFDKIVKEKYGKPLPSSPDVLMISNDVIYLIEFKNQTIKRVKSSIVKNKLTDGREIINQIFNEFNLDIDQYQFNFCVIYKNEENKIRRGIKRNIIRFDLSAYKGKYFDEIYTNDVKYFTGEYKKYFHKELKCTYE